MSPQFHVNALKSHLGAFARAYLFNVYFTSAPVNVTGGENIATYLVRSTSLPESTVETVTVPGQGQEYKMGSTHTFAEWECTFNIDRFAIFLREMKRGNNLVHSPSTNIQGDPSTYYGEIQLELLDVYGLPVMFYTLHQAWPSTVGAVDLAHDNKGDVAQVSCTFTYNWHTEV